MNESIMPAVSSPNGDKGLSVESFAGQPTLRSDCTSPVKPLVTPRPPHALVVLVVPRRAVCVSGQGTVELHEAIDSQIA